MLSSRLSRADFALTAAWLFLRRLLYGAVLIVLLAVAAALGVAALPRLIGHGTLVVNGGSMGEAYPNGSLVIARWTAVEDVQLGDVIVVQEETDEGPAAPKLHRVVSLDEEGDQILVRTKGDANQTSDPKEYTLPDRVLVPALTVPYLGYLARFAMAPLGWVFLVLLPAAVLALLALRTIWADDDHIAGEETRSGDRSKLPPTPTLPLLLFGALMIGAVGVSVALGLFIDTASVAGNTFTTAASFP